VVRAMETKFLRFGTRQEQDSVLLRSPPGGLLPVFRVLAWSAEPPPHERGPGQCRLNTSNARRRAGDQTIMSIAGHILRAMLLRYSHVGMEANPRALDEIAARQNAADERRKEEGRAASDCRF
jgi:hypothetical protein